MAEPEKTHDLAKKTDREGASTTKAPKDRARGRPAPAHSPESEGKPKQIKPDGR